MHNNVTAFEPKEIKPDNTQEDWRSIQNFQSKQRDKNVDLEFERTVK